VIYYPSNAASGHWQMAALDYFLMLDNQAMASMTVDGRSIAGNGRSIISRIDLSTTLVYRRLLDL